MEVKEIISDLGEADFEGEKYLLVGRVNNLSAADNVTKFMAAVNLRAQFPAPVVIIPVPPVMEEEG